MRQLLEELWYSYEMERSPKWSKEEKQIVKMLDEHEEKLLAGLTDEQKEQQETIRSYLSRLNSISEKEAYRKGIQFATAYLLEALIKTDEA